MHRNKIWYCACIPFFLLSAAFLYLYFGNIKPSVRLMDGTSVETGYVILSGRNPGKTVFIIGGIHGDETSGMKAAEELKKIKSLESGTIIILSPANALGSKDRVRNVGYYRDLNRSFPGDKNRDLTDQLAAAIYQTIADIHPDIVIDLHEAYREGGNRDFLGNSIIFTDSEGIGELALDLILETQDGSLCSQSFSCYGPAPAGSLNYEVTKRLGIPVITIEASEEDPIKERVENHIQLTQKILQHYSIE